MDAEDKQLLHSTHEMTNKIFVKIMGDDVMKTPGIVHELSDIKTVQIQQGKDIETLKNKNYKNSVIVGTLSGFGGWLAGMAGKSWFAKVVAMFFH